ncbi:hypothetical protein EKD04_018565 [Chloroflexales bacterium ZM16-3]|nr:hypothetical protein [Chloroflexales bacterium ZM16-3]
MARTDTSRRQQLVAGLKSAVATAAIVGTLGGWAAFSPSSATNTASVDTGAVAATVATSAPVAAVVDTTAASTTASGNTTVASASQSSQRGAVTSTRSSR